MGERAGFLYALVMVEVVSSLLSKVVVVGVDVWLIRLS